MLNSRRPSQGWSARGFSLIELMISVTIGLIVAAGAVKLIVAIDQANSETIQSTRLTQELRSLAGLIAGDLKRAQRLNDPIAAVAQGISTDCPTTGPTPKTPAQPCYKVSTDPSGATATQCVAYGYTGTIASTSVYNYRTIRRVVTNGVGALVLDQATIDADTAGTDLLTVAQMNECPIHNGTAYTLSSPEVDITTLCFSSFSDGNTCFFDTSDSTCKLNTAVTVVPAGNEVDICIGGTLRTGDVYTKTITRAFIQPVFIRSTSIN